MEGGWEGKKDRERGREGERMCVQKQDQELTAAQIMNSLLPNSDLN